MPTYMGKAENQNDALSTYASMLSKADGVIDWSQGAHEIDCQIRALNPWPGTHTRFNDKIFKIKKAKITQEVHDKEIGMLLNREGDVACGKGQILRILSIQPEGKAPMDMSSAINGGYLKIGDVFS